LNVDGLWNSGSVSALQWSQGLLSVEGVFLANLYCFPRCPIATGNIARLVHGAISKQKRTIGIHFCLLPDLFIGGLGWRTGFSTF
jgi:hypothetical protein